MIIKVNKERQRTLRTNKMRDMYTSCQTEEDYNQIIRIFQLHVKTPDGSLLSAIELPWLEKKCTTVCLGRTRRSISLQYLTGISLSYRYLVNYM